jgi:hypothetical protein
MFRYIYINKEYYGSEGVGNPDLLSLPIAAATMSITFGMLAS